jgi:hypothetical protein
LWKFVEDARGRWITVVGQSKPVGFFAVVRVTSG